MINIFAHAAHMEPMVDVSTFVVALIGAGLVIAILLGIIIYMAIMWQPKSFVAATKNAQPAKKTSNK